MLRRRYKHGRHKHLAVLIPGRLITPERQRDRKEDVRQIHFLNNFNQYLSRDGHKLFVACVLTENESFVDQKNRFLPHWDRRLQSTDGGRTFVSSRVQEKYT